VEGRARKTLAAIRPLAGQPRRFRTGSLLAAAVLNQVASHPQGARTNSRSVANLGWHRLILQRGNWLIRAVAELLARAWRKRSFSRFSVKFDNPPDMLQNRLHAPAPFYHF